MSFFRQDISNFCFLCLFMDIWFCNPRMSDRSDAQSAAPGIFHFILIIHVFECTCIDLNVILVGQGPFFGNLGVDGLEAVFGAAPAPLAPAGTYLLE